MKHKFLLTASVITFLSVGATNATADSIQENSVTQTIEKGWVNTKDAASQIAEEVSETSQAAYNNIKTRIINPSLEPNVTLINVDPRMTAKGMISEPVYNVNGERIAKVKDIVLDSNGNADMVVLADGDFTGLGKLAAFKYQAITISEQDGDLLTTLTEEMIDAAIPFTYEREDDGDVSQTIGAGGLSLAELMDADIVDNEGNDLADIENITLRGGRVDQVIAEFNDTFGLGGDTVAIGYNELSIQRLDDDFNFVMSEKQAAQFEVYKEVISN